MNASADSKYLTYLLGRWFVLIITILLLVGCQTANYGRFRASHEVEKIFASGQVLSDHKYYYTGSNAEPSTIMGIHQDFTLDDEFWNQAKDIQKQLKSWTKWMKSNADTWGYSILAPDGKQIGIYYSRQNPGFVIMGENNQVVITMPDTEIRSPFRGDGDKT